MRKSLILAVLFTLFVAILVPNASAYNIGMELSVQKVSGCPSYAIPVNLTITNNDDVTHTYILSLGLPQGWKFVDNGFIQPDIMLVSGKSKIITFWINPPTVKPDVYSVIVKAKNGGEEASRNLEVEVLRCHDVSIEVDETIEICEETDFKYTFGITNNGKEAEEFEITISRSWDEKFFKETLTIGSGETGEISVNATSPEESGRITVKAESKESYAKDEKQTQVNVKKCYDLDAGLQPTEASACLGGSSKFSLTITNLGTVSDTYSISLPDWVVPGQESVMVESGEEESISLSAYPEFEGKTSFDITLSSQNDPKLKKTLTGSVEAIECKGVTVIVSPASQEVCKGIPANLKVTVKNTGTVSDSYDLETDAGTLENNKVSIEPGEIGEVSLTVNTKELEFGENMITVKGTSGETSDQNTVSLLVENCFSADFGVSPEKPEVCAGDEIDYTLVLKNVGDFEDDYTFVVEDEEIGYAQLEPNELKMFSTKMKVDFPEGEYNITFKVVSEYVSKEAVSTITVKSKDECYNVEVSSEELEVRVEPGKGTVLAVKVKNTGGRTDSYSLELEGPEWAYLSEDSVSLDGDEEAYVYLYISPGYEVENKTYDISLKAESANSVDRVDFRVGAGVEPEPADITEEEPGITLETGIPTGAIVGVTGNTGKVVLLAVIVLFIIVILAVKFVLFVK